MNYEKIWNDRKRTLINMILAGKKAGTKKEYDAETYEIVTRGDRAKDELVEMVLAEVNQYDAEHTTRAYINSDAIMPGAITLTDCNNESEN